MSFYNRKSSKYVVIVGVFLLNISGGFTYFYGNLHAYMVSYYKFCLPSDRVDLSPAWILSMCLTFLPIGSLIADAMKIRLGLKVSMLIAVALYVSGILLSYWSVQHSVWATTLTFGVVGMFGLGIFEVLSYSFTSKWFPDNQGFAGSVVSGSSAVGAILYNSIITAYINPRNSVPNFINGDVAYFTQSYVLDRVPMTFVLIGILTFVAQTVGLIMVTIPDYRDPEKNPILEKDYKNKKICTEDASSSTASSLSSLSNISDADKVSPNVDKAIEKCNAKKDNKENIICVEVYGDNKFDQSPKCILKSVTFYLMSLSIVAMSLALLAVGNYKLFAQVWITDDDFLTMVGNSSALTSMFMRFFTGYISDKFRMKNVFIATLSTTSIFMAFWYFTARLNRWIYFFSTNILFGLTGSVFVLYPLASMKFFGLTYFATNTGLVLLAMTLVEVASAPVVTSLISSFGWFGLFFTVSFLIAASFIVTTLFMQRKQVL